MGMLDANDLKQIGDLLDTKLDTRLGEVLEAMNTGFSGVQTEIGSLARRVTKIEATMVTKDYLDDKLAPINGKINVLVDFLRRNGTISDDRHRIVHS